MINGHGDDIYKYEREIKCNFSSNIYNRQDLSALQKHLCSCIHTIRSYPEPDAASLSRLLAGQYQILPANICITNGATEAIYLIAQAFSHRKTAVMIPTFSEYEEACILHRHTIRLCQSPEDITPDTRLAWICNPNNPTGLVYKKEYLKRLVIKHPDTIFVFDQSYKDFTTNECWEIKEACQYQNIILIHSMTKNGCIPGLRLGYLTAHDKITAHIANCRMPWSVNQLAIEAGKFLLKNPLNSLNLTDYLAETKRLQDMLAAIDGITVFPTQTHFFLCRSEKRNAGDLKEYLVNNHDILIRDASNFKGLNKYYFRLATQSREENDQLVKAIKEWI